MYLVLEYAERGNLFAYIRRQSKLGQPERTSIFRQVCEAIAYMHNKGIIHRDLKPENILLDANKTVKVCDFGWSARISNQRQTFCGTYEYMAPEIFAHKRYDEKVDVWGLGILLYEILHGYSPFKGESTSAIYNNILKGKIRFKTTVDMAARKLILRILRYKPEERPTVEEILKDSFFEEKKIRKTNSSRTRQSNNKKEGFDKVFDKDSGKKRIQRSESQSQTKFTIKKKNQKNISSQRKLKLRSESEYYINPSTENKKTTKHTAGELHLNHKEQSPSKKIIQNVRSYSKNLSLHNKPLNKPKISSPNKNKSKRFYIKEALTSKSNSSFKFANKYFQIRDKSYTKENRYGGNSNVSCTSKKTSRNMKSIMSLINKSIASKKSNSISSINKFIRSQRKIKAESKFRKNFFEKLKNSQKSRSKSRSNYNIQIKNVFKSREENPYYETFANSFRR